MLCFADFTGFTNASTNNAYCPPGTGQQMKLSISDSPDVLQFCVNYTGSNVVPAAIPTYYNPGANGYNSEAYLGNNGFYTGISGNPALYQTPTGPTPSSTSPISRSPMPLVSRRRAGPL